MTYDPPGPPLAPWFENNEDDTFSLRLFDLRCPPDLGLGLPELLINFNFKIISSNDFSQRDIFIYFRSDMIFANFAIDFRNI